MGFFVVVLLGLFFWVGSTVCVSYVMDSGFLTSMCRKTGDKPLLLCWIPFYGQYRLGRAAGIGWAGVTVALCHGMMLLILLSIWVVLPEYARRFVNSLFYPTLIIGFGLKEWIIQRLLTGAVTWKRRILILIADVMTLGLSRSIILFALRKRVLFAACKGAE